jgi:diadenosine tetraphosphate (Ap4A) HIT family hydrolase
MAQENVEERWNHSYGDYMLDTEHWVIFLAPNQSKLGTCVLALKRDEVDLAGLKKEEWGDFTRIVPKLEDTIKEVFQATMFNWGCLMNSSYLQNPPDPHVHWHFIPRYKYPVEFAGLTFDDPFFGYMKSQPSKKISLEVKESIINTIKENLVLRFNNK